MGLKNSGHLVWRDSVFICIVISVILGMLLSDGYEGFKKEVFREVILCQNG